MAGADREDLVIGSWGWFGTHVEFRILGSVDVRSDGVSVAIGGPKLRTLLAVLLLDANHVVSRGRLIDAVWGERRPPSASHTLDDYVWRLGRAIGADRIERCAPGYRLCVRPGELDFDCFEERLGSGREGLAGGRARIALRGPGGRPRIALEDLDVALALWRGPALADVELERSDWCAAVARLEDRRLLACEERMEAALALGRSAELIVGLETLVAHNPFRERLRGQLMLALYRAGRHADALAVYQDMRLRLADDRGVEPGPTLRALQRRILEHDQSLRGPCSQQPGRRANPPRAGRRPAILAALLAAGALAAAAVAWTLLAPGRMPALPRTASGLVELSVPSGSPVAAVEVAVAPAAIAATSRAVWLADPDSGSLSRIDPRSGTVAGRIGLGGNPGVVAFGGGSLWVAGVPGDEVHPIDPTTA